MNIFFALRHSVTARIWASVLVAAMVISAIPLSQFIAYAANTDAAGSIQVDLLAAPSGGASEYVDITFTGTGTLNLDGWTVEDTLASTNIRYTFSAATLTNGQSFRICSSIANGTSCDAESSGGSVWNNTGGDSLVLRDETATPQLTLTYSTVASDEVLTETASVDFTPPACTPQFDSVSTTLIQNTTTGDYFDTVNDALSDCDTNDGDTIQLLGDITLTEQITLDRPIVLDGGNNTIHASFAKTTNSNNSAIGIIGTSNVTIQDVTLDGTSGTDLHGINVYESTSINVDNVTSNNFRSGMVVNGSTVDAADFSTAGNIWHGINVAPGSGVTSPSVLNILETSTHSDTHPVPHIFTDNINAGPTITVNDLDSQYDFIDYPSGNDDNVVARAYYLATNKVDICHWNGQNFIPLNVSVQSIGAAHGAQGVNDGDIIPVIPDVYGGQNLDVDYNGSTGAEVLANDCVIPDEQTPVYGCMDPEATNYNELATEQGDIECEYDAEPTAPQVCSYAGTVVDYSNPAYKNNGNPVDANRRATTAVQTIAPYVNFFGKEGNDWNVDPLDFFSLGIGGTITYEFTEQVALDHGGDDIAIWEITGGPADEQAEESVEVYVSANGIDFVYVDTVTGDGSVSIGSAGLPFVKYVRLVDTSQGVQGANGDGYDLDAITIIDDSCGDEPSEDEVLPMCSEFFTDGIVISQEKFLLSHDAGGAFIGPETVAVPAGYYDINVVSFDFHSIHTWDTLELEQWFINGLLNDAVVFTSSITPDLPDDQDAMVVALDSDVYLENGLDAIEWVHGAYPNQDYHSIHPLCVQFMPAEEETQTGPYCGDGVLNQGWEQCDGGADCTDYCTFANQCSDLQLAKITLDPTISPSFDGTIHLGSAGNTIPNGTWFDFETLGDTPFHTVANEIDGLAVTRVASTTELALAFVGGNSRGQFDVVSGTIETKGIDLGAIDRNPNPQFKLEGANSTYPDIFTKTANNGVIFDLGADTGNDAVTVEMNTGEEYDCVHCHAEVEARVVLRDEEGIEQIFNGGNGNLMPQVILGDGTVVPFGDWFKVSAAAGTGSAEWIDDPETVTNYPDPETKEGLFVSREGNGQIKVALYGYHTPGGDTNYESLRATIEFNDASIVSGATTQIPGDFKLENHSETDSVQSNDNFDSFTEAGNLQSVDFDLWVDTKADGFTITLDEENYVDCEYDTDPSDTDMSQPITFTLNGYGWVATTTSTATEPYAGLSIFAHNLDDDTLLSTTTDFNGYYGFVVATGTWNVYEVLPTDWQQLLVEQDGSIIPDDVGLESCTFTLADTATTTSHTCDFTNILIEPDTVSTSTPTIQTTSRGGSSSGTRTGGTGSFAQPAPTPLVLGASTSQCPFLFDYMQMGIENDPWEVTKLQLFLNIFVAPNPITGFFGSITDANVKLFQSRYQAEVLDPWFDRGIVYHNNPTGFVYKTTLWKINDIVCPDYAVLPIFEGESTTENIDLKADPVQD